MRKSKAISEYEKEKQRWEGLITAAMERKDYSDLFDIFYDECLSRGQQEEIQKQFADILTSEGYVIVNGLNMIQQDKLKEFIEKEIYPSYNDQQKFTFI